MTVWKCFRILLFPPRFCEKWNYAKQNYTSSPTSLFSAPLGSTGSLLFSEFGVQLIPFDQKITFYRAAPLVIFSFPEFFHLTTLPSPLSFYLFPSYDAYRKSHCWWPWTFYPETCFCPSVLRVLTSQSKAAPFLHTPESHRLLLSWVNHCDRKTLFTFRKMLDLLLISKAKVLVHYIWQHIIIVFTP